MGNRGSNASTEQADQGPTTASPIASHNNSDALSSPSLQEEGQAQPQPQPQSQPQPQQKSSSLVSVSLDDSIPVRFDWPVYVDATLAGLSALIPIPFVDNLFERFFRRRMFAAIAARRGVAVTPEIVALVNNRRSICAMFFACIWFPLFVIIELLISLFRILLYCYTVKKSTDALNYYWQRAFLMDYMLQRGYLSSKTFDTMNDNSNGSQNKQITSTEEADVAIRAMERLLDDVGASPMERLARKIIYSPCRILCSLMRFRGRREEDVSLEKTKTQMSESWSGFSGHLRTLAHRYDAELQVERNTQSLQGGCLGRLGRRRKP